MLINNSTNITSVYSSYSSKLSFSFLSLPYYLVGHFINEHKLCITIWLFSKTVPQFIKWMVFVGDMVPTENILGKHCNFKRSLCSSSAMLIKPRFNLRLLHGETWALPTLTLWIWMLYMLSSKHIIQLFHEVTNVINSV